MSLDDGGSRFQRLPAPAHQPRRPVAARLRLGNQPAPDQREPPLPGAQDRSQAEEELRLQRGVRRPAERQLEKSRPPAPDRHPRAPGLMLGEGFLIMDGGPLDGSRSAYFNGLRLDYALKNKNNLTFFFVRQPRTDTLLPVVNDKEQAMVEQEEQGVGFYFSGRLKKTGLEAYLFRKDTFAIGLLPARRPARGRRPRGPSLHREAVPDRRRRPAAGNARGGSAPRPGRLFPPGPQVRLALSPARATDAGRHLSERRRPGHGPLRGLGRGLQPLAQVERLADLPAGQGNPGGRLDQFHLPLRQPAVRAAGKGQTEPGLAPPAGRREDACPRPCSAARAATAANCSSSRSPTTSARTWPAASSGKTSGRETFISPAPTPTTGSSSNCFSATKHRRSTCY